MCRKIVFRMALIIVYQLLFTLQANARTIFIDGISPGKTSKIEQGKEMLQRAVGNLGLAPERREVSYLYKSNLGKEISSKDPEGRATVPWNGDASDKTEVNRAVDATIKTIEIIHNKGEKINIVSHSYGTVIAYDALKILANPEDEENKKRLEGLGIKTEDVKDIKIDTFITMGSPLGKESIAQPSTGETGSALEAGRGLISIPLNKDLKNPGELHIEHWLNYYTNAGDIVGGKIDKKGVKDIELPGYGSLVDAHGSYFKENANRIAVDFNISTKAPEEIAKKYFDSVDFMNEIKTKSIQSFQQAAINASTQYAFQFPKTLTQGELAKIPHGQIGPELAKKLASENPNFDSSQNSTRTPQQKLTPVSASFTETFNGLFTQSPDYLNSPGGNHSGTLASGTRTGAGSVPGSFTSGSFSGRTLAETGYTPSTLTNQPFSGTSVGSASAKGFQEGTLSGSMTITVPAGTQTATVSGGITINTDGSLSMPSYSGPVTDNNSGNKVGTMSGKWSQGATH